MDDERLIDLRTYDRLQEAELAASLLEASGIECSVRERYLAGANPELMNAVGGAAVMVWERDVENARKLLAADHTLPEDATLEVDDDEVACAGCGAPLRNALEPCRRCNSEPDRVTMTPRRTYAAIYKLKLGIVIGFLLLIALPAIWEAVDRKLTGVPENAIKLGLEGLAALIVLAFVVRYLRSKETRL
jgi:hypothetical protein